MAHLLQKEPAKAEAELRAALRRDELRWELWNDLAVVLLDDRAAGSDVRRDAVALDAAARAVRLSPHAAPAWFNLGVAAERLGLTATARTAWQRYASTPDAQAVSEALRRDAALPVARDAAQVRAAISNLALDDAAVASAVADYPQIARETLFEHLLPRWAQSREAQEQATIWSRAESIAATLRNRESDLFAAACLAEIRAAVTVPAKREMARAISAQADGFRAYFGSEYERAAQLFISARDGFGRFGDSCRLQSEVTFAATRHAAGALSEAEAIVVRVEAKARAGQFPSIVARARWLHGLAWHGRFDMEKAVDAFQDALAFYEKAGEFDNAASVARGLSDAYRKVGDLAAGWNVLARHLKSVDRLTTPNRRYLFLFNASLFATDEGLADAALVFQSAAVEQARLRGVPSSIVEGLVARASLHEQLGDSELAAEDLAEAESFMPAVEQLSASAATVQRNWLRYEKAKILTADPALARLLLSPEVFGFFSRSAPDELPRAFYRRGRLAQQLGRPDLAERDIRAGIAEFEQQWTKLITREKRTSFLAGSWDLFAEMIVMSGYADHARDAFGWADSARARGLTTEATRPVSFSEIQGALPSDATLVYFVALPQDLLRWRVTRTSVDFAPLGLTSMQLSAAVAEFRAAVQTATGPDDVRLLGSRLYASLFGSTLPNAGTLLIAADGPLHELPFAALVEPSSRRFLAERHGIALVASAREFVFQSSERSGRPVGPRTFRMLAVGGPSNVSAQAGFSTEAAAIAARYGTQATVLTGETATPSKVLEQLGNTEVLHVAAHAQANPTFPWSSRILLAPDRENPRGWLTADSLAAGAKPKLLLAVLAACETAAGSAVRGEGLIGLVRPLMRPGSAVIGTLWPVLDHTTSSLVHRLHERFLIDADAIDALRRAQVAAIESHDPTERLPRTWAAFVAYGARRR